VADPKVYFDENQARLMLNYRIAFFRLALYYGGVGKEPERAVSILDRMEQIIPRTKVPIAWELSVEIMNLYYRSGRVDRFVGFISEVEAGARAAIAAGNVDPNSVYSPIRILYNIYDIQRDYPKMLELLRSLAVFYPTDTGLRNRINALEGMEKEANKQNP